MNTLVLVFCLAVSAVSAAPSLWWDGPTSAVLVGPANPGALLKGPADGAKILGPDGSVVVGGGQAGALLAAPQPGGVVKASTAPGGIGLVAPIGLSWGAPIDIKGAWGSSAGLIGVGLKGW